MAIGVGLICGSVIGYVVPAGNVPGPVKPWIVGGTLIAMAIALGVVVTPTSSADQVQSYLDRMADIAVTKYGAWAFFSGLIAAIGVGIITFAKDPRRR